MCALRRVCFYGHESKMNIGDTAMEQLRQLISHPKTEKVIIGLIILNAITLGLETIKPVVDQFGGLLHFLDTIILWIFVVELTARIIVNRLAFFKDPWSLFDFFVIAIALIPSTGSLSVLRALRILRVLRLVTVVPALRKVVAGLVGAMPALVPSACCCYWFIMCSPSWRPNSTARAIRSFLGILARQPTLCSKP